MRAWARRISSLSRVILAVCIICLPMHAQQMSSPSMVDKLVLSDTIQPVTAARLERALAQTNRDHAAALLIELDTPGGLLDSTRRMVGAMISSQVPVIVYIAPAGARGGSAGFFLLEAADIAAMAPGTNAGASHPVLETGTPDETLKQKMENDAAAFLRSYVGLHSRNAEVAETAVRSSKSFSADEALAQHLIDMTAASDNELLDKIDGRTITHNGAVLTLHLRNARIETIYPTVREQILGRLANPNLALLLIVGGVFLVYLEFNVPGTIIPGALGTVMVLLGVFALDLLPIRHTALLLLMAAAVLLVLEVKFASHGVLAAAGIVCLAFGTLTLVDAPIPELRIQPRVAAALGTAFGIITVVLLRLALRARKRKSLIGPAALVGYPATALEPLYPTAMSAAPMSPAGEPAGHIRGHILVQGEIWEAVSPEPLAKSTQVRVTGYTGDVLKVEPQIIESSILESKVQKAL